MAKTIYSPEYRRLIDSLRLHREALGLTQTQLAERLRWPQQRVSLVEAGARRVDVIEFLRWAQALELSGSIAFGVEAPPCLSVVQRAA